MIYHGVINKRIRNIKVYRTRNRIGHRETFMTKLFIKIFGAEVIARPVCGG